MTVATVPCEHDIVLDHPVEPYAQGMGENFIDGPLLGNGDLGAANTIRTDLCP